jgi:hypothetical protein
LPTNALVKLQIAGDGERGGAARQAVLMM